MLGGKLYTAVFNTDNNNNNKCFWFCFVFEHQVSIFEGFLKGSCVTLKTVTMLKIQLCIKGIHYILNIEIKIENNCFKLS